MEERKSAKEWLLEEKLNIEPSIMTNIFLQLMERFADYRTAEIQATIINFRMRLKAAAEQQPELLQTLQNFDETFKTK